jgi:hypothetical protein
MYFNFLLSAFCFSSLRPSDHRGHDGHQFVGFLFDGLGVGDGDAAFFAQEFEPKLCLIGFLECPAEF